MIRALWCHPESGRVEVGDHSLIDAWRAAQGTHLWLDLADNDPEAERRLMIDRFGLHPLAVSDALHPRHPPKLEGFADHAFLLLKGIGPAQARFDFATLQIAIFVGTDFLVTRHSAPSTSIDRLWQELQDDPSRLVQGPDAAALRLARLSIDHYTQRLLTLEPWLEDLEDDLAAHPRDATLAELTRTKTDLRRFRRVLRYHVQIFEDLLDDDERPPQITAARRHEINDVYEHQERAASLATLYYEVATDLIDGTISLASHRLNNIMKVLTIVTAIFVLLSFLAGVYGMNFEQMPELHTRYGYFILLGVMATLATTLLVVFRRKRWI
ncbi:MAG: magnesium transporter CorA family protein [Burkholderiaceae bacterium]|nr:magnesium transporter CorA family protein [Rhodoferax sp.]MCP5285675.1 magnesium transporter CorA family protein [Burkholderiaceae bacterium]